MEQPDFFPIPSPCIGVCEANAKGYCKGCLRSREERLYWQKMTDDQKHQVMRLLSMRKNQKSATASSMPWQRQKVGVEAQSGFCLRMRDKVMKYKKDGFASVLFYLSKIVANQMI